MKVLFVLFNLRLIFVTSFLMFLFHLNVFILLHLFGICALYYADISNMWNIICLDLPHRLILRSRFNFHFIRLLFQSFIKRYQLLKIFNFLSSFIFFLIFLFYLLIFIENIIFEFLLFQLNYFTFFSFFHQMNFLHVQELFI